MTTRSAAPGPYKHRPTAATLDIRRSTPCYSGRRAGRTERWPSMSATTALASVMAAWLAIGVMTGIAMSRRGHDGFTWLLLGATLGPLVVPLALSTWRRTGPTVGPAARAWPPEPRRRPPHGRRTPRVAAAWLLGWIDRIHRARVRLVAERYRSLAVVSEPAPGAAATPGAKRSSSARGCASAMSVYRAVATFPPVGLNGRRAAQVRRPGGRICLASASRPGGGREER
jgi:hypothetical protein